jgi:hypothetical protein
VNDTTFLERITGAHRVNAPIDDAVALRVPPHSMEAEQSLLGAMVCDATSFEKVSDLITAGDFYSQSHRQIFMAMTALIAEGAPVDVITTFERLDRDGQATGVGGVAYLNAIAQSVPSAAHVRRYAETIVERARLRAIIAAADEVAAKAFKHESADTILDDAKVTLGELSDARRVGAGRVPLLSLGELREHSHASPWLIKHVLPGESIGMLYGGSGTFKSFIAIDMALHIAHGLPWLGRRTRQGSVVYIAAEGGSGLWPRICAWHRSRRLHYEKTPLHVVPVALDLKTDAWRVVESAQAKGLEQPSLVIVDTLSQTFAGEENNAGEVAAYFREIGTRFRELWKCAVLIIHHTGHIATERPRGSSAMRANLDFMFGVFRDEKEMLATVTCSKQKDGEGFTDAIFSLSSMSLGTDEDGDTIRSLVARHLTSAEDVQQAMAAEGKAGRGGNNSLLLRLLQNGMRESELRTEFMKDSTGDSPDARRQAWARARSWAVKAGFFEVVQGVVITLKRGSDP